MTATAPLAAPAAPARPRPLSPGEEAVGVVLGLWMIVGLFLDGWAHDNNKPETFFTPWHGVLYSGFAAAAVFAVLIALRARVPGRPLAETMPRGHGLTLGALAVFAAAAVGDLVWHELFGIEVGVEALLSPTHLLLLAAGVVALSAPIRAAWVEGGTEPRDLRAFLPTVVAMALLVALVGFFLLYLSPFVNDAAGTRFTRLPAVPHEHPSREVGELQQLLGIASILMTTVLLVVPIHLVLRRWRPPAGSLTVLLGVVVVLFVGLDEFAQWPLLAAGVAGGAAGDAVARRAVPLLTGVVTTVVLWLSYFALYQVTEGGVAWTAELWTGAVFLAALVAAGIGLLTAPLPPVAGARVDD